MSEADLHELIRRVAQADRAAFEALFRALEKPLFRFVSAKLNDPFEASDVLQEVFIEVWRSAARFEGRSTVKTWMFGIAYRKTMDRFRKNARLDVTDAPPEEIDDSPDALTRIAAGEEAEGLRRCLGELSAAHRMVIELAFFEDMNYREVALAAGVAEGTVKTRIFHAKKLLLRCLSTLLARRAP